MEPFTKSRILGVFGYREYYQKNDFNRQPKQNKTVEATPPRSVPLFEHQTAPFNPKYHPSMKYKVTDAYAVPAIAIGAQALGTLALGAVALGACAIGAIAIGRLAVGKARVRRLEIDELVIRHLHVTERLTLPPIPGAD